MGIKQALVDALTLAAPFPASTAISRGDLLWWDSANKLAKRASARTDLGALALNQIDFAPLFLGVMQDQRLVGETSQGSDPTNYAATSSLRVLVTDGVFDCPCASATWKIGDLVGVDRDSTNTVNYNQQVVKVTSPALAIGYVVKEEDTATTVVRCRLISNVGKVLQPGVGGRQGQAVTTLTDAAQTLTVASSAILNMVPTAARNVTLAAEAQSTGLVFYFTNNSAGAFSVTFKASDGATAIKGNGVVPQNKTAVLWCDGTNWNGLVSA